MAVPTIDDDGEEHGDYDDELDSTGFDPEAPEASEMDPPESESSVDTIPCPYCRRMIFEQAEICPYCDNYISKDDHAPRKPRWVIYVGVLLLIAILIKYGWTISLIRR